LGLKSGKKTSKKRKKNDKKFLKRGKKERKEEKLKKKMQKDVLFAMCFQNGSFSCSLGLPTECVASLTPDVVGGG